MRSHLLTPNWDTKSLITAIRLEELNKKGIRAILLDVDGTLLPRTESKVHPNVKIWLDTLKPHIFIHLLSNNPSKQRISNIANQLGLTFTHRALKPSRHTLLTTISNMNLVYSETAMVGDRIFTDVLAGNRIGIYTILVNAFTSSNSNNVNYTERFIAKVLGGF